MNRRDFIWKGTFAALATMSVARVVPAKSPAAGKVRVAQIGTAHAHASEKWRTLNMLGDSFDCVGIAEPDATLRAKALGEEEYRGAVWMDEADALGREDVEAILVEAELPDLLRLGRKVLESGKHLHIDKPPGRDIGALRELQAMARANGRVLQHGYMYRYHPAFRFCLDASDRGWLGRVFAIHGDIGKVIGSGRRKWLADNYGGSTMLLGCHLIDIAVAIMGPPASVKSHRRKTHPDRDDFSDNEMAVLEYPHGIATIRSMLTEVGGEDRRQFVVCGENATIEIMPLEPAKVRIAFKDPPPGFHEGYQDVALPEPEGRYMEQLRDFADMARGAESVVPRFDSEHELLVHRVLLEAAFS